MIQRISTLKQCIVAHIADLKEETGYHPKWREVNPLAKSTWPMFPVVYTNASTTQRTKK
jgi:hypothetical protein